MHKEKKHFNNKKMRTLTAFLLFTFFALTSFSQNSTTYLNCNNPCSQEFFALLKGWQTLIAAIIVIIGWFVNSWLNRKAEISKRRLEHRLTALKSVVDTIYLDMSKDINQAFNKPDFKDKLENVRAIIQMYGYREEIDVYEEFIDSINIKAVSDEEQDNKLQKINECIPKLRIIIESLRTELGLEVYKKKNRR